MTNTTPLTTTKRITIGWTMNNDVLRAGGYVSFSDGYRIGAPQVVIPLEVQVPDLDPLQTAEIVFDALNNPAPSGFARGILEAVQATGYKGEGAHFSLSVGDTVEVDGTRLACESFGWKQVG